MKKEENIKIVSNKNYKVKSDLRSRSQSPKAYLGCGTCKLRSLEPKKVKSIGKFSDYGCNVQKNKTDKPKKVFEQKEKDGIKKNQIKLTDLCDEDKKRIVELIEELSKFAEKNHKLQEMLEKVQQTKNEQQDYIINQAEAYQAEKNLFVNELNDYKCKLQSLENEMSSKMDQWKKQEKFLNKEINFLAKALQDSLKDKNELTDEMKHLKMCLRSSLESFQRLRAEVSTLQLQENICKMPKSTSCQTEPKGGSYKEKYKSSDYETDEEELLPTNSPKTAHAKSSLDVINDKLEHVYQLLKRKSENLVMKSPQKFDIDLSILLRNEDSQGNDNNNLCQDEQDIGKREEANIYKFLKPFDQCSKTSVHAERILKKIGKPLNVVVNDCSKKTDSKLARNIVIQDPLFGMNLIPTSLIPQKIVQQNHWYNLSEDEHCDEDKLMKELFYAERSLNFEFE